MVASLCGSDGGSADYDSKLSVFTGDCLALECIGGNDDGGGDCGLASRVEFFSNENQTYFIHVHGFGGASGNFGLAVTCAAVFDDCNSNGIPDECEGPCGITLQFVAGGLASPVFLTSEPGDASRLYILEQNSGRIRLLKNGTLQATPFLDIGSLIASGGERGLLCMTFDPDYATNGFFYVYYTNTAGNSVLARYSVSANPDLANSGSAVIMKTVNQDFSNHNGGTLAFGPDGMLYWSLGDGGSGGDPNNRAQNPQSLLGKMLRLDVDNGPSYIPGDNPYVGNGSVLDEIWAMGLRNPWRFSFDWLTGDMYIGDVGQNAREELNFEPAFSGGGYNWGWRCYEGNNTYNTSGCSGGSAYDFPFLDYATGSGGACSVVGGYVYRGCDIPGLSGTYFYADYCAGWIRSLRYDPATGIVSEQQDRTSELGFSGNPVSFGQDADGELYIVSITGSVYRIVPDNCGGPGITDCNNNGIDDATDIANGTSEDCNANGIPDECESAGGLKSYTSSPNAAIPDGSGTFISDTLTVSESGTIEDVNVNLDIDHTWNGDLIVRLTHNGTTVVLIDRPGYSGSGFGFDNDGFLITLDDKAIGGPIEDADSGGATLTSPPSYSPQEALTAFDGMDKTGDWIIEVSDNATQDTGALVSWSLDITNQGGAIDPCIEDCNDNGIADELDISSGMSADCNLNGIP
ncbi:MAG: PQQ-dependent sugar dehydrogenase, partial [Phycisphaerales bacterium]|nr:PQQ-dependent sugar dehydrogenase [Phycisphaerales bacterium]